MDGTRGDDWGKVGGWHATRAVARWGCFLPDLTRLASGSSTTNLPAPHIVSRRADGKSLSAGRKPLSRDYRHGALCGVMREPGRELFSAPGGPALSPPRPMTRTLFSRLPQPEPSTLTGFSGNTLDRRSESRNEATLAAALADPSARIYLLRGDDALLRSGEAAEALFTLRESEVVGAAMDDVILLGWDGSAPRLATTLTSELSFDVDMFRTVSMRSLAIAGAAGGLLADTVDPAALGALAQARALLHWHASCRFCGRCGTRTTMAQGGYRRDCPNCNALYFPRTDPVAIMLAIDGDRCLMGRQARFAPGTYSCLAGFVEPGETIEDAVRREISEEAGIRIGRVGYHASQPWPFPMSLMIGCFAEATSTDIVPDTDELEDCRWFTREETLAMLEGTHPGGLATPPRMAIAHTLIRAWAEQRI